MLNPINIQFDDLPGLSVRLQNCLKNANIRFISEAANKNEDDFLEVKNFGKKALTELKEVLARFDLKLKPSKLMEIKQLKERVVLLEHKFNLNNWLMPSEKDVSLAEDEWWAIFYDYPELKIGSLSKTAWAGGSNKIVTFKVKKI